MNEIQQENMMTEIYNEPTPKADISFFYTDVSFKTDTHDAHITISDTELGVLMRMTRSGIWVNPDIPTDQCARGVLSAVRFLLQHTIETEANRLATGNVPTHEAHSSFTDKELGLIMRMSRSGVWVNPDIPMDECARRMLDALSPLLQHTIQTEANQLVAAMRDKKALA